ncbi:hypothetical protein B0H10DRAFT_907459 [Mycena sp. CBHHK59/15]|nr:hypothetical protein B0H10DRAFT_907459 [Mycena sp. CBHHK59/15]
MAPVFFAKLDPAAIPTVDQLDGPYEGLGPLIWWVIVFIQTLTTKRETLDLPQEACVDLWPRVWRWIEFMDTYRDSLPAQASDTKAYAAFVSAISHLQDDKETLNLVDQTPGVREFMARAWVKLLQVENGTREAVFHTICRFMTYDLKPTEPRNLGEFLEGSGGNVYGLASLAVRHINLVVAPDHPITNATGTLIAGAIILLDGMDDSAGPMSSALLSAGIVNAVTAALCAFGGTTLDRTPYILPHCLDFLLQRFSRPTEHLSIADALGAGLLRGLIKCAMHDLATMHTQLELLLSDLLPKCTVYYTALARLYQALLDVKDLAEDPRFQATGIYEHWKKFVALAEARLAVAKHYDAGESKLGKPCDNVLCDVVWPKKGLKCCSACQKLFYCSEECQSLDWREGAHRKVCQDLHKGRLKQPDALSTRDRSFARHLAYHDYKTAMRDICIKQIDFMSKYRDQPYFLLFDYTGGDVSIDVQPVSLINKTPDPHVLEVHFWEQAARAARSRGRMQLAAMRFAEGRGRRFQMISMTAATSAGHDMLRRIAEGIPVGTNFAVLNPYLREILPEVVKQQETMSVW